MVSQTLELEHRCAYSFAASLSSACHSACWDSSNAIAAVVGTVATAAVARHSAGSVDLPLVDAEVCRC